MARSKAVCSQVSIKLERPGRRRMKLFISKRKRLLIILKRSVGQRPNELGSRSQSKMYTVLNYTRLLLLFARLSWDMKR